ncbi:hypothetical protein CZ674_07575 [Agrococcus casei LMG 22410]|uniref:Uncharacterized protein n=1 Tax=Agrococcus casei LMG 22410 TaxID=1255656 RepID=A0A1R4FZ20_9MICO|nr:hypothetical protein CZ674_07575 [Agrococcus casei LMG 22410]
MSPGLAHLSGDLDTDLPDTSGGPAIIMLMLAAGVMVVVLQHR